MNNEDKGSVHRRSSPLSSTKKETSDLEANLLHMEPGGRDMGEIQKGYLIITSLDDKG